ncbi:LytTR family DNA-binding domain-containing protein [Altererythrobacter epoxidivorans]|nr:LytTR family DNA-binding domain-containing protein [Altererythrobacter epoxidivorans]
MNAAYPSGRKALLRKLLVDFAIMAVIGVVLALIGPLGTFREPIGLRLIAWVLFCFIGYALYSPIDTLAQRLAPALDLPVSALRLAGVLLSSIPMAVVVWVLPRFPGNIDWPGADKAIEHYLYVVVIGGMITFITTLMSPPATEEAGASEAGAPTAAMRRKAQFLERLPPALGSDLIALEMEDHYVRAHTPLGSELILMRMRDAVAELGGIEGMQVHRSWWVARGAVEDVEREGRNVRLVLGNGITAPVSRAKVAVLKDAGWI